MEKYICYTAVIITATLGIFSPGRPLVLGATIFMGLCTVGMIVGDQADRIVREIRKNQK